MGIWVASKLKLLASNFAHIETSWLLTLRENTLGIAAIVCGGQTNGHGPCRLQVSNGNMRQSDL